MLLPVDSNPLFHCDAVAWLSNRAAATVEHGAFDNIMMFPDRTAFPRLSLTRAEKVKTSQTLRLREDAQRGLRDAPLQTAIDREVGRCADRGWELKRRSLENSSTSEIDDKPSITPERLKRDAAQ